MKLESLHAIQNAFEKEGVRFVIVGGLAVVAHGYLRATHDADITIELIPDQIARAFRALASIGYEPTIPITVEAFSDPEQRRIWAREKNMTVLQFWSSEHKETSVDLFVDAPFEFDEEWKNAYQDSLDDDQPPIRFARIDTLIAMKERAGRPQDLADVDQLRWIRDQSDISE